MRRGKRLWIWWTSGKDSAWTLYSAARDPRWEPRGLVTAVNEPYGAAETHGVGVELIKRQAAAVGLPLRLIEYDSQRSSIDYEEAITQVFGDLCREGAEAIAFSDLSAARHRERSTALAAAAGLEPVFPLWGRDSRLHASSMLSMELSAWVCSVVTEALPATFVGRRFDESFLADLPSHVDPCGETDEFHTFVEWAPGFKEPILVEPVRTIDRYDYAIAELELVAWRRRRHHASLRRRAKPDDRTAGRTGAERDPFHDIERLRRVKRYVDQRLADRLYVDAVAGVAAMTSSGFGRYFRRHVGMTFGSWLARRRVDRACALLSDPDLPVTRVAKAVGLGSDRNLRRVFRKVTGSSPSEYRRQYLRR